MLDDYHRGIRKVEDVHTFGEAVENAESDGAFGYGDFQKEDAEVALKKGSITIYSSKPFENGVFVSTSKEQSADYAGGRGSKFYSMEVPLDKVAWIDADEGMFADTNNPTKETLEKETKTVVDDGIRFRENQEPENMTVDAKEVNDKFNEELQKLTEENADKVTLSLGMPSDALLSSGIYDRELKLYGNKVIKKMKKHGFGLEELKNLPVAVANPIVVFNNIGREGNRSILTELKTEKGNFLVTVDLGKDGDLDFNIVSSVFGKDSNHILDWLNKGLATFIDKEKALAFLYHQSAPIAATAANEELSSAAKVVKDFENPTLEEGKITSAVENLSELLHTPVKIIHNMDEIKDDNEARLKRKRGSKGWYDTKTGEVVIVVPNNKSAADVQMTVLHEVVAHKGLRKLFGKDFDTFLYNVYANATKQLRERINVLAAKNGWDIPLATEEYMAKLAEDTDFENAEKSGWWSKIKDFFMEMLAKAGIKLKKKISDNELRYILWRSYRNLKDSGERNVFDEAGDIARQYQLKVGDYAVDDMETADGKQGNGGNGLLFRDGSPEDIATKLYSEAILS